MMLDQNVTQSEFQTQLEFNLPNAEADLPYQSNPHPPKEAAERES